MASRRGADLTVVITGGILVLLGIFFFLVLLDVLEFGTLKYVAPVALVLLGLVLLVRGFNTGGWNKGSDTSAASYQEYHPRRPGGDVDA